MTQPPQEYSPTAYPTEQGPLVAPTYEQFLGDLALQLKGFEQYLQESGGLTKVLSVGYFEGMNDDSLPARLPGLGERHTSLPDKSETNLHIARALALGMLQSKPPGTVRFSVYDPQLTNAFSSFSQLGAQFEQIKPGNLQSMLNDMTAHVAELARNGHEVGTTIEPWQVAVIASDDLSDGQRTQLNHIVASGANWGSVITLGVPLQPNKWLSTGLPEGVIVRPEVLSSESIAKGCQQIAIEALAGQKSPDLEMVTTTEMWQASSKDGLEIGIGIGADGKPYNIRLDDVTPHGIIVGPTGSGKTNVLNTIIAGLANTYGPDQVQEILLDFKEGTEFALYAPHTSDPSYLPHALLVGTSVNEDPEFGITALKYMQQELVRRADQAQKFRTTNYAGLRERDPSGNWPRLVAVIDEFQVLLEGPLGGEAVALMTDIGRRGRAFGLHMLLATQSVDGIKELYATNRALFKNFTLRIATPNGSLLNHENTAPADLRRFQAVVNEDSGNPRANVVVQVPDARQENVERYKKRAYERAKVTKSQTGVSVLNAEAPRVFDGHRLPELSESRAFQRLKPVELGVPKALVAAEFSVTGGTTVVDMDRRFGDNLAVVGPRTTEANRVMYTAAQSLGKQHIPGTAKFTFVGIDRQSGAAIDQTMDDLRKQKHKVQVVGPQAAPEFLAKAAQSLDPMTETHYLFVYGADAGGPLMTQTLEDVKMSGRDGLYDLLQEGPENGTHVLATFSTPGRLIDVVTRAHRTRTEAIGAYVAVGVPASGLSAFTPDDPHALKTKGGTARKDRALFYKRGSDKLPRTVTPFRGPAGVEPDNSDDD